MKRVLFSAVKVFAYLSIIFITLAGTATVEAESNTQPGPEFFTFSQSPFRLPFGEHPKFEAKGERPVIVFNIEQLYAAVNDPQNAARQIVLIPGVYFLSPIGPGGVPRPNGGRLDLQENMSLQGSVDDRGAVVIDAINLPSSSYAGSGAVRIGRGSNAVEWLTIRNAINGTAGIETDLIWPGTAFIRIAHVVLTGHARGIDVRNTGVTAANRVIDAEIVDNELVANTRGLGEGIRIVNIGGANGGVIYARLSGNRSHDNIFGMLIVNNRSNFARISVTSSNDQFYNNGAGTVIAGGLSSGSTPANGNTISFTAYGSRFENNNGASPFDHGGLVIIGGENTSFPNGVSNNTVNIELRGCVLANNQLMDLGAFGGRSFPVSAGLPGTNNRVTIRGFNPRLGGNVVTADSIPDYPGGMNSVTFIQ